MDRRTSVRAVAIALAMAATATGTRGEEPLALRQVMTQLGLQMQAVAGAIAREDWAAVARVAPRIAEHPQPPAVEKARILAYIGGEAARFRGHDQKVHDAARGLAVAAGRGDGEAVIRAFAQVQSACLACHAQFRERLVRHFHGAR